MPLIHSGPTWVRMWGMASSASVRWKRDSVECTTATTGVPLSLMSSSGTPHSSMASSSRAGIGSAHRLDMPVLLLDVADPQPYTDSNLIAPLLPEGIDDP